MIENQTKKLVRASRGGDPRAAEALQGTLYDELRAVAGRLMRNERPDHTLQPTALVHEAFVRLVRDEELEVEDRSHLLAVASRCIRWILLEHARNRRTDKRGGGERHTLVDGAVLGSAESPVDLCELDEALADLERRDARQARVVELRFFGGLTIEEAADALAVSPRTVKSDWRFARAWLRKSLGGDGEVA